MKLLFSEAAPDPVRYVYPYAVWGFLEPGETPADAFAAGFLPGSPQLDRFYLVRQLRVPLVGWTPTSENRRVLRKAEALRCELVPRSEFAYTAGRRDGWLAYADVKWGAGVMSPEAEISKGKRPGALASNDVDRHAIPGLPTIDLAGQLPSEERRREIHDGDVTRAQRLR